MDAPTSNFKKKNGRQSSSLRRSLIIQLLTVIILPLTLLLIITAFSGLALHQESMRELAAERNERTVRSIANSLGELIQQRLEITQDLVENTKPEVPAEELIRKLNDAAMFAGLQDASLAFVNKSGLPLATAGEPTIWQSLDPEEFLELIHGTESGTSYYKIMVLPEDESLVLVVSASPPDRSIFALAAFSPARLIERSLEGVFSPDAQFGMLVVTSDQQVLYRISRGAIEHPRIDHPGVRQALDNQVGSTNMKVGNDEHIVAYSPIQPLGWALVIEEPWSTIASRVLRVTENAPLVLIPIIVLTVLALWFTSRYIVRPLQTLEAQAVELGWGNYQAIEQPVGGIDEIRNLQNELIHMAHKVREAQKGLRDYIGAITLGQEEERLRLARELHDDTLQSLIALNQRLQLFQLIENDDANYSKHRDALDDLQGLADQTIQDLRRITRALRPIYLEDLGLVAALEMLSKEVGKSHDLQVSFKRLGAQVRLRPEIELALYRIAQEALTNVIKHATAECAEVFIHYAPDQVTLQVHDDGKGFEIPDSPSAFSPEGHFGLLGIFERAEIIGAQLEMLSNPGKGSQIIVKLPLESKEVLNG